MPALRLPPEVEAVFGAFFTAEFTTVSARGQPLTWPVLPYYHHAQGQIIVTASIAFAVKAAHARRRPQVSLLYSDPTGSRLEDPPAVLVQGDATVAEVLDNPPWSGEMLRISMRRQPDSSTFLSNRLARRLFRFYFQRIAIMVTPRRILTWPLRDFRAPPIEVEVRHVE